MKALIELSVRRPVAVFMVLASLLLAGIFSAAVLPVQRLPDFSYPRVTVETRYPGMGAEDIRSIVTIPIEDALSSVKGLRRQKSISRDGASLVVLDFDWGSDSGAASVLVREAIDAVYPGLPEGVEKPAVIPGDPDEEPQIIAAVRSRHGEEFARNLAEYEIRSRLRRIEGTGAVLVSGGAKPELEIKADLPRAVARGFFPADLAGIIASETANIPAGNAREGTKELVVVSSGRPESVEELKRIIFPSGRGPFTLEDIGKVSEGKAKKKSIFIHADRNTSIYEQTALEIYRKPGADPLRLSREVRKALDEAAGVFARDAEIVIVWDDAPSITDGLWKLLVSSCFGIAAVMVVLFFALRRFRYGILAGFSIPLSACASLTVLAFSGSSLNGMSISGIALGIGLVSDTAVIILDLLHTNFASGKHPSFDELGRSAASVAASSLGGTLTTAVVFLPILFLPGPLGSLFKDLSIALVVSIVAGWAYAQFALPCLYRVFFKSENTDRKNCKPASFSIRLLYTKPLRKVLRKPQIVFAAAFAASILGILLLLSRPAVFISPDEVQELELALHFPAGSTPESMSESAAKLAGTIAALPEFAEVFGRAGAEDEDTGRRANPDYRKESFLFRCILNAGYKPEKALAALNKGIDSGEFTICPAGTEYAAAFPRDKTEKLLGLSASMTFAVKGKDPDEVKKRLAAAREHSGGSVRPSGLRPEIRILPDREASAFLGISSVETARAVYAASEGAGAGELEIDGRPLPVKISGGESSLILETLPVAMTESGPVFLGSLASIEYREVPSALLRLDRSDAVYLDVTSGSFAGYGTEGISRADDSVFTQYRSSLILTTVLVLLLLYLTIAALFESFSLPLILLLTVPFSLAGAGPALFMCGSGINSSSVLGLVVLFGIAVNNGLVLFERSEEKIKFGFSPEKAVYGAAGDRLHSVLATTLTTVFALLPLVLSPLGGGQRSMSAAMMGGITASTLLSLFALPPVFIRYFKGKKHESQVE